MGLHAMIYPSLARLHTLAIFFDIGSARTLELCNFCGQLFDNRFPEVGLRYADPTDKITTKGKTPNLASKSAVILMIVL